MKKKSPFAPYLLLLAACQLSFSACNTEGVKLNRADREQIDTLVARQVQTLAGELDKYCRDSSAALRQRYVDSLLVVREREIMMQNQPVH